MLGLKLNHVCLLKGAQKVHTLYIAPGVITVEELNGNP